MLKTHREEYYEPRECDVICGRGKTFAGHPGNKIFLRLVRSSLDDYVNATGRFDRTLIVSHIAANFREYGVRFARVGGEQPGMGSNKKRTLSELIKAFRFFEINDERKIHEKIGHAFRDMIRAQGSRSLTPAESNDGSSPSCESDSEPSESLSEPTKKVSIRKRTKKSELVQQKTKRQTSSDSIISSSKHSEKESLFTGSTKPQITLNKGHGHQENLALAFFEVESHVHKIHDGKGYEESTGVERDDPFVPDVSILFDDSDSLAGLSFNSNEDPTDSHNDGPSIALGDSHSTNTIPERILVHWSKEHDQRESSDFSRDRSTSKGPESKYDVEAVRWSASHAGMSIDPRRLLQEPLINDWHMNAVEYCADFNPTNFDMSLSLHNTNHPSSSETTENKQQEDDEVLEVHEVHDDDHDVHDDEQHDSQSDGKCEFDV